MEYIITIGDALVSCSCNELTVIIAKDKRAEEKIKQHAEKHGAEEGATVIVRNAWWET